MLGVGVGRHSEAFKTVRYERPVLSRLRLNLISSYFKIVKFVRGTKLFLIMTEMANLPGVVQC